MTRGEQNVTHASHLTIGELARFYAVPAWKIRRVVDSLADRIEIFRAGAYRLVPRSALGLVAAELERQGWFARERESVRCR